MKPTTQIKKMMGAIKAKGVFKSAINPPVKRIDKPLHRERDMRQESMDMGSHGAKEYFGGSNGAV